ncbi:hypothetical protein [Xanthomonas sp. XNM01]|uniref:CopD family copper resistance protein n=1 Tax=Xanthomonas sp. XNM01 TaxID=2769289 RepID=UPI00177AFE2B|nr:hypothetical protein [Xanthomonas sp. XNM01]MBD9368064.1 hypothetical protein [Xanthomonas sp. XNM01]
MTYYLLLVVHLLCAFVFIGTVFFEVLMLEAVRRHVPREAMAQVERAIGDRARALMPWVLLSLYGAGLGLAWHYRPLLQAPLASAFGLQLLLKLVLAASILGHFCMAMRLRRQGRLRGPASRRIHLSVFVHMLGIVLLAKGMFHLA